MLSVSVLDSSAASKVSLDSTADHQMAKTPSRLNGGLGLLLLLLLCVLCLWFF
jgi:hypothetical protein